MKRLWENREETIICQKSLVLNFFDSTQTGGKNGLYYNHDSKAIPPPAMDGTNPGLPEPSGGDERGGMVWGTGGYESNLLLPSPPCPGGLPGRAAARGDGPGI